MGDKSKDIQENFKKNLKPADYRDECLELLHISKELYEFPLKFIHDVLKSGRFSGSKLLEIGSGATVHNIASASYYFPNIIQSDFVQDNVNELKRWHEGQSSLDWSEILHIVAKIEGFTSDLNDEIEKLKCRIQQAVKCIVTSNILSDDVIPLQVLPPDCQPPYDLIVISLCLLVVSVDLNQLVDCLKRLNKLLRLGGGVIITEFENGGHWKIGQKWFHYLKISFDDFVKALNEAGFENLDFQLLKRKNIDLYLEHDSYFCIAAEKCNEI